MEVIQREIFVKLNTFKEVIEMSQGTDGIPVIFKFEDYDIPVGTTAMVFVQKPSGKAIQDVAVVNAVNDTITVNMNSQMTAEVGESMFQIQLTSAGKNVFTFNHPLTISKSAIPIISKNGSTFLEEYIKRIEQEIKESQNATDRANNVSDTIEKKAQNGEFSASMKVGSVVTGQPGTAVSVDNTGTKKDAVFDIKIPQGAQGESGVMVPTAGMFSLYLDPATGNLYAEYPDGSTPPHFELEENGNLYYITDDGGITL